MSCRTKKIRLMMASGGLCCYCGCETLDTPTNHAKAATREHRLSKYDPRREFRRDKSNTDTFLACSECNNLRNAIENRVVTVFFKDKVKDLSTGVDKDARIPEWPNYSDLLFDFFKKTMNEMYNVRRKLNQRYMASAA